MAQPSTAPEVLTVRARDPSEMEARLEQAAALLQDRAQALGDRGILVTRHSPWDFTLQLDPEVPYGLTLERCDWRGTRRSG